MKLNGEDKLSFPAIFAKRKENKKIEKKERK